MFFMNNGEKYPLPREVSVFNIYLYPNGFLGYVRSVLDNYETFDLDPKSCFSSQRLD